MKYVYNLERKTFLTNDITVTSSTLYSSKKKALDALKDFVDLYTVNQVQAPICDNDASDIYFLHSNDERDVKFKAVHVIKEKIL